MEEIELDGAKALYGEIEPYLLLLKEKKQHCNPTFTAALDHAPKRPSFSCANKKGSLG